MNDEDIWRWMSAVRLSVNLSPDVANALKAYGLRNDCSLTETIRRAISALVFIDDHQRMGHVFDIIDKGGRSIGTVSFREGTRP